MANPSTSTEHFNSRLLDATLERFVTLTPLRGYASTPLVSLKEAVKELHGLIDDVDSRVWTATDRSKNPADGLTSDESAAIVLYTIEWDFGHSSLYSLLNKTLRLEDRNKLVAWFPYLKLLLTALFKLPSIRGTVWRGVKADLSSEYKLGETLTWWGFSSCTTSIDVLANYRYLGRSNPCTLFAIQCLNGKAIKRHSYFVQEDEILLLPCIHFKVIGCLSRQDGLNIIHLLEVSPPYELLQPPFPLRQSKTIPPSFQQSIDQRQK